MNGNEVAELRQLLVEFKASMDQRFDAMDYRFDRLEKKVDDLADVVQGMAKGHAARFEAIDQKIARGQSVMTSSFPGIGEGT
jgi:hypothetical protein